MSTKISTPWGYSRYKTHLDTSTMQSTIFCIRRTCVGCLCSSLASGTPPYLGGWCLSFHGNLAASGELYFRWITWQSWFIYMSLLEDFRLPDCFCQAIYSYTVVVSYSSIRSRIGQGGSEICWLAFGTWKRWYPANLIPNLSHASKVF